MLRSHWDILFDFVVFLTALVVLVYSSINIHLYNQLKNGDTGEHSQSQADGMFGFSIAVAIWAVILLIWAGWRLARDIISEERVLKIKQAARITIPTSTTTSTVVPAHAHVHGGLVENAARSSPHNRTSGTRSSDLYSGSD